MKLLQKVLQLLILQLVLQAKEEYEHAILASGSSECIWLARRIPRNECLRLLCSLRAEIGELSHLELVQNVGLSGENAENLNYATDISVALRASTDAMRTREQREWSRDS